MVDEEKIKDSAQPESPIEETAEDAVGEATVQATEASVAEATEAPEEKIAVDVPQENGRRLVMVGLAISGVLAMVSIVTARVFQFANSRLTRHPQDLPVNDHLLTLWKEMTSNQPVASRPLGIQENLVESTKLKTASPAPESVK